MGGSTFKPSQKTTNSRSPRPSDRKYEKLWDLNAPGEEHRKLASLVGAWEVTVKFPVGPGKEDAFITHTLKTNRI
jgi:hypothetical protein